MTKLKRRPELTEFEKFSIITGIIFFNRSHNSLSKEFNCSCTAIRNVFVTYKANDISNTRVSIGNKNEPYWDNEWCYASDFNPFFDLKHSDVAAEEEPEENWKHLLVEI